MKKLISIISLTLLFLLLSPIQSMAHELYIQPNQYNVEGEVTVNVFWGHLREFIDKGNAEDYELRVKKPNGEVEELSLEAIGVHARSIYTPTQNGEYVFFATRAPSVFTPDNGVPTKSVQMTKYVFGFGEGDSVSHLPVEIPFEIVATSFTDKEIKAKVLYEESTKADVIVTAYGPKGEVLEGTTDSNGEFAFSLSSNGEWLIKANYRFNEEGIINDRDYSAVSYTTTLIMDNTSNATAEQMDIGTKILLFVSGILIGAALAFLIRRKR